MKICAIVAEYNPLHTGHLMHIKKVKKFADLIVVILTGPVTQRGEFAMFCKYNRAKAALMCGADLVLEMPTIFSCSSAEKFAHAAVKIAKELKVITHISFGSEIGKIKPILEVAKICQNIDKTEKMQFFLKQGHSYPKARQLAVEKYSEILTKPNNILAVEYAKAALNLNFNVCFKTIKRIGMNHNSKTLKKIANSSYIRSKIKNKKIVEKFIPKKIINLFKNPIFVPDEFVFNSLRQKNKQDFLELVDVTEGLENRLFKFSKTATSLKEFLNFAKTKRYTITRLQRILIYSFFNIKKNYAKKLPSYSFVLGFNKKGQKIISNCKKNNSFLFTTNFKKIYKNFPTCAKIDCKATDFLYIFLKKPAGVNFKTKPVILN